LILEGKAHEIGGLYSKNSRCYAMLVLKEVLIPRTNVKRF